MILAQVYGHVQKPILGLLGTTSSILVSIASATVLIQCGAAIIALIIGVFTLRLTLLRIRKVKKELNEKPV